MNVPNNALFQNCINGFAPPNRGTARAPDKNYFTRHLLLNHWPKFNIISRNCSAWCTLPKFHKWFHSTDHSFSGERPRAQGPSCLKSVGIITQHATLVLRYCMQYVLLVAIAFMILSDIWCDTTGQSYGDWVFNNLGYHIIFFIIKIWDNSI